MSKKLEHILVVDDDESMREVIGRVLEREGYQFQSASSAKEALDILNRKEFSLMISDINMPGETGIELLHDVHEKYKDMAVIMETAVDDRLVAIQALYMGAFGYVTKPFNRNELLINITNALRRRELEIESRRNRDELESLVAARTVEVQQSRTETVQKLARAAEFRDNETAQHTVRVGHFCEILAHSAGMSNEFCQKIRIAGQLHDVGKIGIPDNILLKPGKLEAHEFEEIKKHPEIGYRILGDSKSGVLNLGAVIALTHHEKFNGSGYPGGLRGSNIPIAGRIGAICDVFDALTSVRVYKAAMSVDEALGILKKESGEHFDPELINLFFRDIERIIHIKGEYKDHEDTLAGARYE